ncbi:B-cell receptor CD22-like [Glandiceps talaboti]
MATFFHVVPQHGSCHGNLVIRIRQALGQHFLETPITTLVIDEHAAQLNCSATGTPYGLRWLLRREGGEFTNITFSNDTAVGYQTIGDYTAGDFHIYIDNATSRFEGIYRCAIISVTPDPKLDVRLFVIDELPKCEVTPSRYVGIGTEVTFNCSITKAVPPGNLIWYNVSNGNDLSVKNSSVHLWSKTFKKEDNSTKLNCRLDHETLHLSNVDDRNCEEDIVIIVQCTYHPDVSITDFTNYKQIEGESYNAICTAEANPPASVYWQSAINTTPGGMLELQNLHRDQSGSYTCFANNTFWNGTPGQGMASMTLDIQYPPSVTLAPGRIHKENEDVSLTCTVIDANPVDVTVTWRYNSEVVYEGEGYVITNITRDATGYYKCRATNEYFNGRIGNDSKITYLDIQYAPTVIVSGETTSKETEEVTLQCMIDANPNTSVMVKWIKDGNAISTDRILTLSGVNRSDAGQYTCIANNTFYDNSTGHGEAAMDIVVQCKWHKNI